MIYSIKLKQQIEDWVCMTQLKYFYILLMLKAAHAFNKTSLKLLPAGNLSTKASFVHKQHMYFMFVQWIIESSSKKVQQ